jgi:hypothetical protein
VSAPENLYELGRARQAARADKNFALADQLRDQIAQAGYEIVDVVDGFELHAISDSGICRHSEIKEFAQERSHNNCGHDCKWLS